MFDDETLLWMNHAMSFGGPLHVVTGFLLACVVVVVLVLVLVALIVGPALLAFLALREWRDYRETDARLQKLYDKVHDGDGLE